MNNETAKLLVEKEIVPNGYDSPNVHSVPTIHKEYLCPCGQGKIVEERVAGFDDWFARIDCKKCSEKYVVRHGCGHIWELVEK